MAIFIPGMRCAISGLTIGAASEAVAFPVFVANEADPLYIFSDAVLHVEIFRTHPLAEAAQSRLDEARLRTEPSGRRCFICEQQTTDRDNYIGLGHLVEARSNPLHRLNYAHFHRSCLATWHGLPDLITEFEKLDKSGAWGGEGLKRQMTALRSLLA